MAKEQSFIYVCSDAVGETADAVVRATIHQFSKDNVIVKRFSHIQSEKEIDEILKKVTKNYGFIAYTLVQPHLRKRMQQQAVKFKVKAVDVMGPMMQAYIDTFNDSPKPEPGQRQVLDEEYFKRIEAVEFAVKYDDGKDPRGLLLAEVVLVGVSRTSKTPLSIFLAHKGIKTANLPILPDTEPPRELFVPTDRMVIGLTIDPTHLLKIRSERLKALGLPNEAKYAAMEQINRELATADALMKKIECHIINVSNRSIEETAGLILNMLQERA